MVAVECEIHLCAAIVLMNDVIKEDHMMNPE